MSFYPVTKNSTRRSWHTIALPLLLLVSLTALSFFAAQQVSKQKRSDRMAQFKTTSIQTVQLLQEKLNRYPQLLKSTRGMVINHDFRPNQTQWHNFFHSLNLNYRKVGIIGISYTEYVDKTTREHFISDNRRIYGEQFDIFPQTNRDENFVIMQAVPEAIADKIRGYDIGSELRRYEAAQYAKNSGQIAITNPISLLPTDQYSLDYLMLEPVYANAEQPDSGMFLDSDMAFSGWITIGFSLSLLIEQTLADINEPLRLRVHDPRSPAGTLNFDSSPGDVSVLQHSYQRSHMLDIGDEPIKLVIMPAEQSASQFAVSEFNHEVLIVSLLTSLLAALSLRQVLNARQSALRLAARMIDRSQETNFRYQALFEQSPEAVIIHINRGIVLCNQSALRLMGAEHASELVGRDIMELVHPDSQALVESRLKRIKVNPHLKSVEQRIQRLDGSSFLAEVSSSQIIYDSQPGVQVMFRDITAVKESRNQAKIAQRVLEHTHEAIMVTNLCAQIVMTNPAFTELTGYSRDEVANQSPTLLGSGHHDAAFFTHMWQHLMNTGSWVGEVVNRRKNGEIYIQQTNISAVYDKYGDISHFVCLMSDITEQKKALESIRFQAMHDNLTRLPNRTHFEAKAKDALKRAQQLNSMIAIFFIDLDGFKPINDTWGHAVGDKLLIALAERLSDMLRSTDTLARIGGDEFLILVDKLQRQQDVMQIGEQTLKQINSELDIDGVKLRVSASIGVSIYPVHHDSIEQLIESADAAMYEAKHQGKNQLKLAKIPSAAPSTPALM